MSATLLAERAFLGVLLVTAEPTVEGHPVRWLRQSDFADPWHRELFACIRDRALAGDSVDPRSVGLDMMGRLGPTRAALTRLAALIGTAPTCPDPRTYAVMVLDASLRREIAGLGVLLQAAALAAVLDGSPRPLLGATAAIDAVIDAAELRRRTATDAAAPGPVEPRRLGADPRTVPRRLRGTDQALAADRLLQAHPMPGAEEVADHEATLIASLIQRPIAVGGVRHWLKPDAITNTDWRPVYATVLDLTAGNGPIDTVTVAWHTRRAGGRIDPAAISARVDAGFALQPGYLARIVASDHLRLRAAAGADALRTVAQDPRLELDDVLAAARSHTSGLRIAAAPLGGLRPVPRTPPAAQRGPIATTAILESRTG